MGSPESVTSSFKAKELPTWTLRLLSQVRGIRAPEIPNLLVNTFGGYCASRDNPQWFESVTTDINDLVTRMARVSLVELEGDIVHLTLLGRACGASSLSFESSLRLVELMNNIEIEQIPPVHVLGIIQVLAECDAIYTPVMKRGRSESRRLNDASTRYGLQITRSLQRFCSDEIQVWQRCKRAAILWDWLDGASVDTIEQQYSTNPFQGAVNYGDIIRIVDATRFHLRSAHQILTALFPQNTEFLEELDKILIRLEFGLPVDALELTELRIPLERGQYLALYRAGYRNQADIDNLSEQQLKEHVGTVAAVLLLPESDGNDDSIES